MRFCSVCGEALPITAKLIPTYNTNTQVFLTRLVDISQFCCSRSQKPVASEGRASLALTKLEWGLSPFALYGMRVFLRFSLPFFVLFLTWKAVYRKRYVGISLFTLWHHYVWLPSSVRALEENYHLAQLWPTAIIHRSPTWWSDSTPQTQPQSLQCTTETGKVPIFVEVTSSLVVLYSRAISGWTQLGFRASLERTPVSDLALFGFLSMPKTNWVSRCCLVNGGCERGWTLVCANVASFMNPHYGFITWILVINKHLPTPAPCQNIPLMFPL